MKYSTKQIAATTGFTLIELLVVIAIIGVLAATVVVSLSGRRESAESASIQVGVSAVRSLAVSGQFGDDAANLSGTQLCQAIYPDVSNDKAGWDWDGTASGTCNGDDANVVNEICCHSDAKKWVVWGRMDDASVYCADSENFRGKITRATGNDLDGTQTVQKANSTTKPVKCK